MVDPLTSEGTHNYRRQCGCHGSEDIENSDRDVSDSRRIQLSLVDANNGKLHRYEEPEDKDQN